MDLPPGIDHMHPPHRRVPVDVPCLQGRRIGMDVLPVHATGLVQPPVVADLAAAKWAATIEKDDGAPPG